MLELLELEWLLIVHLVCMCLSSALIDLSSAI